MAERKLAAVEDNPEGKFEDVDPEQQAILEEEAAEKPKRRIPNEPTVTLDSSIGWSDTEGAINLAAMLTMVRIQTGNTSVGYEVRFRTTPEFVNDLAEVMGDQTFTAEFAGKLIGNGAVVSQFRGASDADGNKFIEFFLRMPEVEVRNAPNVMTFVKKAATLALVPEQMSFDLTKRS
jgi:hypothetical protein